MPVDRQTGDSTLVVLRGHHYRGPERAEALILCIFSDLTAAEAGQVIGKSEAAIKMLVFRGLKDLREKCSLSLQEEK